MGSYEYHVEKVEAGLRIDKYLMAKMTEIENPVSRAQIQKVIQNQGVLCNDKTVASNYKVRCHDHIQVTLPAQTPWELKAEEIPMDVIFEDNDLLVLNKPAGMVVHPSGGHRQHTLVHAILAHCAELAKGHDPIRPGIVHRLDKETSGLLVIAKTDQAHAVLTRAFQKRQIHKTYQAIVYGHPKNARGVMNDPITRSRKDRKKMMVHALEGKDAVTHYRVLERLGPYSVLSITLETGRTHQIRVHMSHSGCPVVGDKIYRPRSKGPYYQEGDRLIQRQALHAAALTLKHPITQEELSFECPLPADMQRMLEALREKHGT